MEGEGGVEGEIYDLAMLAKRGFFFLRAEERRLKRVEKRRNECSPGPNAGALRLKNLNIMSVRIKMHPCSNI